MPTWGPYRAHVRLCKNPYDCHKSCINPVTNRCQMPADLVTMSLPFFLQLLNLQTEDRAFRPATTGDSAQSPP